MMKVPESAEVATNGSRLAGTGKIKGPDPFRYSTSDHITAYFPALPLEVWSKPYHVTMSGRF